MLLVGAATLADVELAVPTPALGVDEEGEGRAAAYTAVLQELLVPGEDAALAAFLIQPLLHLAGARRAGGGGRGMRRRKTAISSGAPSPKRPTPAPLSAKRPRRIFL